MPNSEAWHLAVRSRGTRRVPFAQATAASRILEDLVVRSIREVSCRAYEFLCIDLFAGRANKDELFQTHSELRDRAKVPHSVATRGADERARAVGY
jgi:hypothetical protein